MQQLKRSDRIREYKNYPANIRGQIAIEFLQSKRSTHRKLDETILGKDPKYTRGFQSMGILKYQGIGGDHHGAMTGKSVEEIVNELSQMRNSERVVLDIQAYQNYAVIDHKRFEEEFENNVEKSMLEKADNRKKRLLEYDGIPLKIQTISYAFIRSPDIVAEALMRANGICEKCKKKAPFLRKNDGTPYLEVHHIKSLSDGGTDSLENVIAICPNCHRKFHFG